MVEIAAVRRFVATRPTTRQIARAHKVGQRPRRHIPRFGPTHASNLKCYCRFHHLLKTFYCGVDGWREQQLPDGTLILTSPTGHTYTTKPGSALLFPALCKPTATLWTPGDEPMVPPSVNRGLMMPKRRRTRNESLARRIHAERKLNDEYVAERNKPPPF